MTKKQLHFDSFSQALKDNSTCLNCSSWIRELEPTLVRTRGYDTLILYPEEETFSIIENNPLNNARSNLHYFPSGFNFPIENNILSIDFETFCFACGTYSLNYIAHFDVSQNHKFIDIVIFEEELFKDSFIFNNLYRHNYCQVSMRQSLLVSQFDHLCQIDLVDFADKKSISNAVSQAQKLANFL